MKWKNVMRKEQFKVGDIVCCKKESNDEYEIISVSENREYCYNIKAIEKGFIYRNITEDELELKNKKERWMPLFEGDDTVGMYILD